MIKACGLALVLILSVIFLGEPVTIRTVVAVMLKWVARQWIKRNTLKTYYLKKIQNDAADKTGLGCNLSFAYLKLRLLILDKVSTPLWWK